MLISMIHINAMAMATNDTDYSCHTYKSCTTWFNQSFGINHIGVHITHIMPLVINSIGGRHTHTYIDIADKTILRNQSRQCLV